MTANQSELRRLRSASCRHNNRVHIGPPTIRDKNFLFYNETGVRRNSDSHAAGAGIVDPMGADHFRLYVCRLISDHFGATPGAIAPWQKAQSVGLWMRLGELWKPLQAHSLAV